MVVGQRISPHARSARLRDSTPTGTAALPHPVNDFLRSRVAEQCTAPTVVTYERRLRDFFGFIRKAPEDVQKADIQLYILDQQQRGLSPHYVASCYSSVRAFYNWMVDMADEDEPFRSPLHGLKRPKTPKFAKPLMTEAQFLELVGQCDNGFRGLRDRAWLMLLATTGCRFEELATLELDDLDWKQGRMHVTGKGRRDRYVPLGELREDPWKAVRGTAAAVDRYLTVRPPTDTQEGPQPRHLL